MNIDIRQLIASAHQNYIAAPYPDWAQSSQKQQFPDIYNVSEARILGKPYFMTLSLAHQQQIITLPNEPLVAISRQKTIVETATIGEQRIGTVKEYICTEDYDIDIKGVCFNTNGTYPARQVKELNDLFAINDALEVKDNLFFDLFGIQKLVLRNIKFEEMMGEETFQKYTINAISDTPFFAELNDRVNFLQSK